MRQNKYSCYLCFYVDCIGKYSGGEIKYYPDYHSLQKPHEVERFENDLRRYLQRKIGFEAVMRLRCPQGTMKEERKLRFRGQGFDTIGNISCRKYSCLYTIRVYSREQRFT